MKQKKEAWHKPKEFSFEDVEKNYRSYVVVYENGIRVAVYVSELHDDRVASIMDAHGRAIMEEEDG